MWPNLLIHNTYTYENTRPLKESISRYSLQIDLTSLKGESSQKPLMGHQLVYEIMHW